MRRFALALLLAPALAAAQPTAADSALVGEVVDALRLEASLDAMLGPMGEMSRGIPGAVEELFRVDAIDDSLRALLLADVRPAALREALAFYRSPAYETSLAFAEQTAERLADPAEALALQERLQNPKKGALADEALSRRYVRALGVADRLPDMMRRLFGALAEAVPTLGAEMEAEGGLDAVLAQFEGEHLAEVDSMQVVQTRVALYSLPTDVLAQTVAFYESPAGAYLNEAAAEASLRVMIPAMVEFMSGMYAAFSESEVEADGVEIIEMPGEGPPPPGEGPETYEVVEVQPELIGGLAALQARVEYPEAARREGVEGQVVLQFVVDTDGTVVEPVVLRSPDERLSAAALAAVHASRFTPGRLRGEPVRVRFALPLTFRLAPAPADTVVVRETAPVLVGGLEGLQLRVEYPLEARRRRIQGLVMVEFVVGTDGVPRDLRALRSPHRLLTRAAVRAVRGARFEPATRDGQPVEVEFALPVTFRLR